MSTPPDCPIDALRKRVEALEKWVYNRWDDTPARPVVTGPTDAQVGRLADTMRNMASFSWGQLARAAYAHIAAEARK